MIWSHSFFMDYKKLKNKFKNWPPAAFCIKWYRIASQGIGEIRYISDLGQRERVKKSGNKNWDYGDSYPNTAGGAFGEQCLGTNSRD